MGDYIELFPIIKSEIFRKHEYRIESKRPRTLDIMSMEKSQMVPTKNLRYFVKPSHKLFPLNLNLGLEEYIWRTEEYYKLYLKKLEKFLMEHNGRTLFKNKEKQQICTSRKLLKTIMESPYILERDWTVKAIKLNNVIYLLQEIKEYNKSKNRHETYHFKFQQYCFADSPHKTPSTEEPINENNQTSCIFETTLDQFEIWYSAEIAGVESEFPIKSLNEAALNKCRFVLTKLLMDKFRGNWNKNPKLLTWWIQAYLGRVENIYVGFKTKEGFVNAAVECINSRELPQYQRWKPEVCKRFLCDFLKNVKDVMHNVNSPYIIYEFKYSACLKMLKYRILEDKKEEVFLSEPFIQYMQM